MTSPFAKKISCAKISDDVFLQLSSTKIYDDLFLVICLNFSISKPVTSTKLQPRTKMSYDLFSSFPRNLSFFTPVFLQSYNYSCTIHLLQQQMTTAEIVSRYTLKYALANYGALGHVPSQGLEILCILQLLQLNCKISKITKEKYVLHFRPSRC